MSDHTPNDGSTGHEWDGIRELTNKPPKWWAFGFYAGLTFVTCYYIIYPSTPMNNKVQAVVNGVTGQEVFVHGHTKGIMGLLGINKFYEGEQWTQAEISALEAKGHDELTIKAGDLKYQDGWTAINEMRDNVADIEAVRATYMTKLENMTADEIIADDEMRAFAMGRSRVLFGDNCAACHASGGQGNLNAAHPENSFPNLTDDDWLFGGWTDKIIETITDGRETSMPAKGGNEDLTAANVATLAGFVMALSTGSAELNNDGMLTKGASFAGANDLFQETCAGCHGGNAKGSMANFDFDSGAVNLTDGIWRFGGSLAAVTETITNGRMGQMPTFAGKLDETSIKILAVRVHQLGGGMAAEPMEPEEVEEDMMDDMSEEATMDEAV